jgi:hypothetical protein
MPIRFTCICTPGTYMPLPLFVKSGRALLFTATSPRPTNTLSKSALHPSLFHRMKMRNQPFSPSSQISKGDVSVVPTCIPPCDSCSVSSLYHFFCSSLSWAIAQSSVSLLQGSIYLNIRNLPDYSKTQRKVTYTSIF